MPNQLPSGRWRTRVRHPHTGKQISARDVIGGPVTYATEKLALAAEAEAQKLFERSSILGVTLGEWWTTWTTDPLWQRPARSSNIRYSDQTRKFVALHRDLPIRAVDDQHVADWLKGGQNLATVSALRTMFNDAMHVTAGRLIDRNPFANLGLRTSSGRRDVKPPSEAVVAELIALADAKTPPSFAAFLDVACHSGMRPGELDALKWSKVDFQAEEITVDLQWNHVVSAFTPPKHGIVRTIALTEPAAERLLRLPQESEFVFTNLSRKHFRPSARTKSWDRVRCAAGLDEMELYVATRHYFGWYAWNVLQLNPRDIANQFGHQDGGELVRKLYGHSDAALSRERVREAFRTRPTAPTPLRRIAGGNA